MGITGTVPLSAEQWVLVDMLSLLPITVIEVVKLLPFPRRGPNPRRNVAPPAAQARR